MGVVTDNKKPPTRLRWQWPWRVVQWRAGCKQIYWILEVSQGAYRLLIIHENVGCACGHAPVSLQFCVPLLFPPFFLRQLLEAVTRDGKTAGDQTAYSLTMVCGDRPDRCISGVWIWTGKGWSFLKVIIWSYFRFWINWLKGTRPSRISLPQVKFIMLVAMVDITISYSHGMYMCRWLRIELKQCLDSDSNMGFWFCV